MSSPALRDGLRRSLQAVVPRRFVLLLDHEGQSAQLFEVRGGRVKTIASAGIDFDERTPVFRHLAACGPASVDLVLDNAALTLKRDVVPPVGRRDRRRILNRRVRRMLPHCPWTAVVPTGATIGARRDREYVLAGLDKPASVAAAWMAALSRRPRFALRPCVAALEVAPILDAAAMRAGSAGQPDARRWTVANILTRRSLRQVVLRASTTVYERTLPFSPDGPSPCDPRAALDLMRRADLLIADYLPRLGRASGEPVFTVTITDPIFTATVEADLEARGRRRHVVHLSAEDWLAEHLKTGEAPVGEGPRDNPLALAAVAQVAAQRRPLATLRRRGARRAALAKRLSTATAAVGVVAVALTLAHLIAVRGEIDRLALDHHNRQAAIAEMRRAQDRLPDLTAQETALADDLRDAAAVLRTVVRGERDPTPVMNAAARAGDGDAAVTIDGWRWRAGEEQLTLSVRLATDSRFAAQASLAQFVEQLRAALPDRTVTGDDPPRHSPAQTSGSISALDARAAAPAIFRAEIAITPGSREAGRQARP